MKDNNVEEFGSCTKAPCGVKTERGRRALITLFVTLSILLTSAITRGAGFIKPGERAPDFSLMDQFDREFSLNIFTGDIIVILYTGREKSQKAEEFGRRLYDIFNGPYAGGKEKNIIRIVPAGNLKGVPKLLRKTVKGYIKNKKLDGKPDPAPLLLDWKGFIADKYGYDGNEVNMYIIGRDGKVVFAGTVASTEDEKRTKDVLVKLIEHEEGNRQ